MSDLPEGWVETSLGEVGKAVTGKTPSKNNLEHWGKVLDFITPTDFKGDSKFLSQVDRKLSSEGESAFKRLLIPSKSVIVTCIGSDMGKVAINKNDCVTNQQINSIIINQNKYDADFIHYLLKASYKVLRLYADGGSTMPIINKSTFESLTFAIPPLPEQKAIADMLSSFDEKIELLREQNKTLETLAQTIFKEWFVNFKGGQSTPLSELIDFNPTEKIERKKEYLFFDMKTLSTNSMATAEGVFKQSNSGASFREGDTLFAKITPCLENGKTAFVLDLKGEIVSRGSTEFIVMRAKERGSPYLNYCICRDNNFREYAIQSMTGTSGRQRVPVDRLKTYEIQYSQESISKFNDIAKPFFEKIKNNAAQIQSLSKTRDTLLPKLLSGEERLINE